MTTEAPGCTFNEKAPSELVLIPLVVPRSNTVAPGTGPPSELITRPLMAIVCAHADTEHKHATKSKTTLK